MVSRDNRDGGQEEQSMVRNWPHIMKQFSYSREKIAMAMVIGTDHVRQKMGTKQR